MRTVSTASQLTTTAGSTGDLYLALDTVSIYAWKDYVSGAPTADSASYYATANGGETRWVLTAALNSINNLSSKTTPVGADVIVIGDSAASFAGKKVTLTNLFAAFPPVTSPVAWTPTFTGFGTVTNINARSWRVGSLLHFEIAFASGIATTTEARISLGFNGTNNNVTSASTYPTIQPIGGGGSSSQNDRYYTALIEASKQYITIGMFDASNTALTKRNADSVAVSGWFIALTGAVRVEGW